MTPKRSNKKLHFKFPQGNRSKNEGYCFPLQGAGFYSLYPYFSFKKYNHDNSEFNFSNFSTNEICIFFQELKDMSNHTWKEIFQDYRDYYHAHKVEWHKTAYINGFKHDKSIEYQPVYQFKVYKQWRVFGYFNHHNIFKIVWIDKNHLVYPWDK